MCRKTRHCFIGVLLILVFHGVSAKTGSFPNLFNVAKGKPIFAQPAQSTCSRLFFCRSTPQFSSITSCSNAEFCDASCPTRSSMPDYASLFEYALFEKCAFKDFTYPPPNGAATYSVFYSPTEVSNTNCSVATAGSLLSDINDSPAFFTITLWVSPHFTPISNQNETSPPKTLIEKVCNSGRESVVVFSLQINSTAILMRANSGRQFVYAENSMFQSGSWVHLAIQVSNVSLSFFANGTADDQLPLQAFRLSSDFARIPLSNCTFYLGQSIVKRAANSFTGHIADIRYYETTLDNREINLVFGGNNRTTLTPVYIDSECRCPARYPRIADQYSRLCLTNDPTSSDAEIRVNRRAHPLEYITDGDTATFWLSKLINKVVVTIDLLDQYQVFYILLQFYSPLPKKLFIERQVEDSQVWQPWQYYADDCQLRYNLPNNGRLEFHNSINCIQLARLNSPPSLGNISFSALQLTPAQRPGADSFYDSTVLLDFVRARRLRVTFDGHMYDEANYINERHLYFGVFELTASGRCDCNGHASACSVNATTGKYKCTCEGNTAGATCNRCDDLFNGKPYRKAGACQPCNCNGHAASCVYNSTIDEYPERFDAGNGGVCVNCAENTEGLQCESCMDGFYKPESAKAPTDPCIPCDCDFQGTLPEALGNCTKIGGFCQCKANVEGRTCDRCKSGFFGLSLEKEGGCSVCSCNQAGVANNIVDCDQISGRCTCKANVGGSRCDSCKFGFHSLSLNNSLGCEPCQCDPVGASSIFCDPNDGKCPCRKNVVGQKCNKCAPKFFNLTINGCMECSCNPDGVVTNTDVLCDSDTGQCFCRKYVTGFQCDVCMDGYAQFGIDADTGCIECRCANGTRPGQTCDKETGVCACRRNVAGLSCNVCKPSFWNLTSDNPDGCQSCGCDLTGANATCDQNTGRCSCLPFRIGMKCNTCSNGYYKAPPPLRGCLPCRCSNLTSSGQCDTETGQCQCRLDRLGVGGQNCDQCLPGFYGYDAAKGECNRCNCFWPGVKGGIEALQPCNSQNGQCICKEFVTGVKCDQCKPGFSILRADNPYGCSSAPAQQPPPRFTDSNSSAISLVWPPPLKPNGAIRRYAVFRNGTFVANVTAPSEEDSVISYTDFQLTPLKFYEYRIMAFTDFGNTTSIGAVFSTLNGAPVGNLTFIANTVEETAVNLQWRFQPASTMTSTELKELWFQIYQSTPENSTEMLIWRGQEANSTRVSRLEAFTSYIFRIEACNQRSECMMGPGFNVTTNEAPPEAQPEPNPTALSTDSIYVEWEPPSRPNGVITFYELWMREIDPTVENTTVIETPGNDTEPDKSGSVQTKRILVFHPAGMWIRQRSASTLRSGMLPLPPPARNYTVTGLTANRRYEFQIVAQNNVGKVESEWAGARTMEAPPSRPLQPLVSPRSFSELEVTWPDPAAADFIGGTTLNVTIYSVRPNIKPENVFGPPMLITQEAIQMPTQPRSVVIHRLPPFTIVGVILQVCTRLGCINSTIVNGTTLSAAPAGVSAPNAIGNTSTSVMVNWKAPASPNGPPPLYTIARVLSSFAVPPIQVERGTRFPGVGFMQFAADILPLSTGFFGIELVFKTRQLNALLFLAVSEDEEELVSIQLMGGKPYALVDPEGCRRSNDVYATSTISSEFSDFVFSDNVWHKLNFFKDGDSMTLTIDDTMTTQVGLSCATNTVIGAITSVYLGGVPRGFTIYRNNDPAVLADETKRVVLDNLAGCMRDFKVLTAREPIVIWTPIEWQSAIRSTLSQELYEGCPITLSSGYHFLGKGSLIMPSVPEPSQSARVPSPANFGGGRHFRLELSFRAEFQTGLLYFQYSRRTQHLLFVQLNQSALEIGVLVGSDIETANVTLTRLSHINFCDTSLKTVRITKTGSTMIYETLDAVSRPFKTTVELTSDYLYLSSNIYIGGIGGFESDAFKFIGESIFTGNLVRESFGGCFMSFNITTSDKSDALDDATPTVVLSHLPLWGNTSAIRADGCPPIITTPSRANICRNPAATTIYQGRDVEFLDTGLSPFSTYLYSLNASNNAGGSVSLWNTGRTLPLRPDVSAVQPPFSVVPVSGREMAIRWRPPTVYSGMLTSYVISAFIDNRVISSVTITNPGPNDLNATVGGLRPFTAYTFPLTVCNTAGCTTSTRSTRNVTLPEAPEGMSSPVVIERRPYSLLLEWREPSLKNGDLTGYQLFRDDIRIFAGQLLRFNVTGLRVATANRYAVEACTVSGCTRSESVILMTASLPPPAPVPAPLVTPLSSTEVRVAWLPVDSSNGIIQSYDVYMSLRPDEPLITSIQAVANETSPTTALVDKLTPGTTYYFRLTACTNGGCTTSDASSVVTFEAAPENLPPLSIISADSSRLDVFWEPPTMPNGILTNYVLFHNGRQVFSGLEPRHYGITGLPPWSRNEFQLRACNKIGCTTGNLTVAYSLEDAPQGTLSLDPPSIVDARTIRVRFWGPELANGNLTYSVFANGPYLVRDEEKGYKIISDTRTVASSKTWQQSLTISNFMPASNYTLRVNATNARGYVVSNLQTILLPKGAPLGFDDPTAQILGPRSISVRWKPAAWSNGDPVMGTDSAVYMLQWRRAAVPDEITNAFSFPVTGSMYVLNNLSPYTNYEIRVIASNSVAESTYSNWILIQTPEDCPQGQLAPKVTEIAEHAVTLTWQPPAAPNGEIVSYNIYIDSSSASIINLTNTSTTTHRLIGLEANGNYVFIIETCTNVCCNKSQPSTAIRTPSAPPTGVMPPNLVSDSPTAVIVSWSKPQKPNGRLLFYVIERSVKEEDGAVTKVIAANISADATQDLRYVDRSLMPFTDYDYAIVVQNDAGMTRSQPARVRTKPTRPVGVLPPQSVNAIDPESVQVSWVPPYRANGQIEKFVIRVSSPADLSVTVKSDQSKGRPRGRTAPSKTDPLQRVVSGLRPWTEYNITVSACTDGGGCSESPPMVFRTPPASLEDQAPPVASATSQHSMFVQWSPPLKANGPIKAYTLDRIKTREPLAPGQGNSLEPLKNEAWETVYIGNNTYYEDQYLPLFTFFKYRVTAISDFGRATSLPSAENSTFGDEPLAAPELSTAQVMHDSINVTWTRLDVSVLRGGVERYVVALQHERKSPYVLVPESVGHLALLTIKEVPGSEHSVVFSDLIPSTAYTVMLTMHMFGGASKKAAAIRIATADGTPTGIQPPSVRTVSETQLRLFWFPPLNSNGQVLRYIVYVNDVQVKVLPTAADGSPMTSFANEGDFSTVVSDLPPYVVHTIILGACTKFSCGNSSKVLACTVEAPPRDMSPPKVVARGATWLTIRFLPPDSPNGIITRYDLFRKSTDHCPQYRGSGSSVERKVAKRSAEDALMLDSMELTAAPQEAPSSITTSKRPSAGCDYVACPSGHRQCGGVCYASNSSLTCCRGELFETRLNHVCCDSNYVPVVDGPLSEKVCCGGRLHKKVPGNDCCYGNYVPIPPGSTCCYNSMQRNVIVSLGDYCCASLPYRPNEYAQVCFGGVLLNRPEQKACGRRLIPASKVCCASSNSLNAETESADPLPDHQCCGGKYYNKSEATCCSTGKRTRLFALDPTKTDVEMRCCGLKLIPSELSCCNGKPFNRKSAQCADTAMNTGDETTTTFHNCGRGTICPLGASAMCDQCNFPTSERICLVEPRENQPAAFEAEMNPSGGWPRNWNGPLLAPMGNLPAGTLSSWCQPRYVRLYSNQSVATFNDTDLRPYTRYEYFAQVSNSVGSANSSSLLAATTEAPPAGLQPPRIVSNPDQLNVLRINWDPPTKPNGAPIFYKLYRDGVLIFSGDTRSFVDTTDVAPFQTYTYWLVACNQIACVTSTKVPAATLESVPEGFNAPKVANINSTCVNLTWGQPLKPNGLITKYILTLREKNVQQKSGMPIRDTTVHTAGPSIRWLVACNLKPYFNYEAGMEACTQVGCRSTDWQGFITDAALPVEIPEPRVLVVNFMHIDVIWRLPYSPNGPLLESVLYRRRDGENLFSKMVAYDSSVTSPALTTGSKTLNYSDFSVRPGYRYFYKVEYANPAGRVNSSEVLSYGVPLRAPTVANRAPSAVSVNGPRQITVVLQQSPNVTIDPATVDEVIVLIETETGVEREHFNGPAATFDLLSPYTLYEARIKSCFKPPEASCSYSDPVFVRTKPAPPEGPPLPTVFSQSAKSVVITWSEPAEPNGPIDRYEIYRRKVGEEMSLITSIPIITEAFENEKSDDKNAGGNGEHSYIDNDEKLQAFTTYEYRVAAVTTAGRGFSPWATVRTSQARPTMLRPPMVNQTGPYGAEFVWSPPEYTNGPLLRYRIEYRRLNADPSSDIEVPAHNFIVSSHRTSVLISGMKPYSAYSARIVAENSVGAVESDWITFATPEAAPTDLPPLTVEQAASGLAVTLRWEEPLSPNGRITRYALYDMTKSESLLWTGTGRVFEYRRLRPFTAYSVMLEACTIAGCSKTQPQTFRTAEAPPDLLDPPMMKKVNERSVKLKWTPPKLPNGDVIEYELLRFEHPLFKFGSGGDIMDDLFVADQKRKAAAHGKHKPTTAELPKYRRSVLTSEEDYPKLKFAPSGQPPVEPTTPLTMEQMTPEVNETAKIVYRIKADALAESGMFSFVDNDLRPYTRFRYRLRARNSRGTVEIDGPDEVETPEAVPARIKPPKLLEADTDELRLRWSFPIEANGLLRSMTIHRQQYDAEREAIKDSIKRVLIKNFQSHDYVDADVKPDTEYAYALEACTTVGCNISRWRHVKTLAPPPDIYAPPTVSRVNATSATLHWMRPTSDPLKMARTPHYSNEGEIVGYRLAVNGTALPKLVPALETSFTLDNLKPYHFYSVAVAACVPKPTWDEGQDDDSQFFEEDNDEQEFETANGTVTVKVKPAGEASTGRNVLCSAYSRAAAIQTDEAMPQNLSAPRPIVVSSSAIDVQWHEPAAPNGYILEYVLYRNNTPINYCDACFSFTDYDLQPDTEYSYKVAVRNSVGKIESKVVKARTSFSTPDGVSPPNVKPLTPHTVLVTWEKPVKLNGNLVNFTVFINSTEMAYTGLEQHAYIGNLEPYTPYEFCVEVCNPVSCGRSVQVPMVTPEAPPHGMDPPSLLALADGQGQHSGVRVSWHPPRHPNGLIKEYSVERRKLSEHRLNSGEMQTVVGAPVFVYNGTKLVITDPALPGSLDAFTLYEYRITAVNSAGRVSSEWQYGRVHTEQAVPDLLKAPQVLTAFATSAVVKLHPPERVNGYITEYRLFLNGKVAERRNIAGDIQLDNLRPSSAYLIHLEACTVVGCTSSPPAGFKTPDAAPQDIKEPIVDVYNLTYAILSWEMPGMANGNITSHTVVLVTNCKPPQPSRQTDDEGEVVRIRQPPSPLCRPGSRNLAVITDPDEPLEIVLSELQPFTRYMAYVKMVNTHGYTGKSPNVTFVTPTAEPQFIRPPRVTDDFQGSTGKIHISWNDSFALNSPLRHFLLTLNDQTAYEGPELSTTVFADKKLIEFKMSIVAVTETGIAESPVVDFRPSQKRKSAPTIDRYNVTMHPTADAALGIFERPWFIISISVLGLFCALSLVSCAIRRCCIEAEKRRRLLAEAEHLAANSPSAIAATLTAQRHQPSLSQFSTANRSSSKYVRQRPPLTEQPHSRQASITASKRGSKTATKRNAPKPPPPLPSGNRRKVAESLPAHQNQFFSLPHHRADNQSADVLSPACLSDMGLANGAILEHEAPSPPPSVASLHIEVSGPTTAGMSYSAAPFAIDGTSLANDDDSPTLAGTASYVNTDHHRSIRKVTTQDTASISSDGFFQVWAASSMNIQMVDGGDSGLIASPCTDVEDNLGDIYEIPLR